MLFFSFSNWTVRSCFSRLAFRLDAWLPDMAATCPSCQVASHRQDHKLRRRISSIALKSSRLGYRLSVFDVLLPHNGTSIRFLPAMQLAQVSCSIDRAGGGDYLLVCSHTLGTSALSMLNLLLQTHILPSMRGETWSIAAYSWRASLSCLSSRPP